MTDSISTSIKRAGFTASSVAKKAKRNAIKSAITSIISRNMSHNIGSHVVSQLGIGKLEEDSRKKYAAFNSYFRTRLEFLAAFSEPQRDSFEQLRLYGDVMSYFVPQKEERNKVEWQKIIIENISRSDGFGSNDIDIDYLVNGKEVYTDSRNLDPHVTFPNGYIGSHALYIILENIIRNATKHGSDNILENNLKILFSIDTECEPRNLIEITIHDTLSKVNNQLIEGINSSIRQSLLEEHGHLRKNDWGIAEMKICACFLRGIYPDAKLGDVNPPVLEALNIDNSLAFRLYLRGDN